MQNCGITLNLSTWFAPQISLKTGHKSLFERKLCWYKDRSLLDWQNWTCRKVTDHAITELMPQFSL